MKCEVCDGDGAILTYVAESPLWLCKQWAVELEAECYLLTDSMYRLRAELATANHTMGWAEVFCTYNGRSAGKGCYRFPVTEEFAHSLFASRPNCVSAPTEDYIGSTVD